MRGRHSLRLLPLPGSWRFFHFCPPTTPRFMDASCVSCRSQTLQLCMRTTKTLYLFWRARRWGPCASNTTRSEKKRTSVTVCCFYRLERLKGARLVVPRCASLLHLQAWAAILPFAWYVFLCNRCLGVSQRSAGVQTGRSPLGGQ